VIMADVYIYQSDTVTTADSSIWIEWLFGPRMSELSDDANTYEINYGEFQSIEDTAELIVRELDRSWMNKMDEEDKIEQLVHKKAEFTPIYPKKRLFRPKKDHCHR